MAKKKTEEKKEKKTRKPPKKVVEKKYRENTENNTSETVDNIFAQKDPDEVSRKLDSGLEEDAKRFDPNGFVDETSKGAPVDWWEQLPDENESDGDPVEDILPPGTSLVDENIKLKKTVEELQNAYSVLKTRFDEKCAEYDGLAKAYLELKGQKNPAQQKVISDQKRMEIVRQNILRQKYEDEALRGGSWN